jgi:hypothetical protein
MVHISGLARMARYELSLKTALMDASILLQKLQTWLDV